MCYTEIQSCLTAAVFPSILSDNLVCLLMGLCYGEFRKTIQYSTLALDLRDLVNLFIERIDRLWSVEQLDCSLFLLCMQWSSGQSIEPAPMLFALCVYISFVVSSLAIDCEPFASRVDWSASIELINIMLVMTSNSESYIN